MLDVKSIRTLESKAKSLGLEERILIENASSSLYEAIDGLSLGGGVAVVAGRGNNGADVLSCARKLSCRGRDVEVFVIKEKELGVEAQFQLDILVRMKVPVYFIGKDNIAEFGKRLQPADFILEGILGIGIKGEVSPLVKEVINRINQSLKEVVACDIPSGLSPDEGKVLGAAVKADYTVAFIDAKAGFFINEGPALCGEVIIADIGISKDALDKIE